MTAQLFETDSSEAVKFSLITSPPALVAVIIANIQAQVSVNDAKPPAPFEDMTVFHAQEPPAISVADYVSRVSKYAFCSHACLVAASYYIDEAIRKDPKLALSSLSVHRLFITAVILASKYFDDVSYNLPYYAKVGGLPFKELANLEINLLSVLNFRLDIPAQKFAAIETSLIDQLDMFEAHPIDEELTRVVDVARRELWHADIVPVELTCPSDDVDFALIVAEAGRKRRAGIKKMRSSPATSACTDEGPSLSRNTSMASVSSTSDMSISTDTSPASECNRDSTHFEYTSKRIVQSPTTPSVHRKSQTHSVLVW